MVCSPDGLMRYNDSIAIVDDIPLLSQWIKNRQVETCRFLAGMARFELTDDGVKVRCLTAWLHPYIKIVKLQTV